jgi:hypothetical protein
MTAETSLDEEANAETDRLQNKPACLVEGRPPNRPKQDADHFADI